MTGTMFFMPTIDFLDDPPPLPSLPSTAGDPQPPEIPATSTVYNGSLAIGSLKGQPQ